MKQPDHLAHARRLDEQRRPTNPHAIILALRKLAKVQADDQAAGTLLEAAEALAGPCLSRDDRLSLNATVVALRQIRQDVRLRQRLGLYCYDVDVALKVLESAAKQAD
jgi:hypothetical protein